MHKTALAVAIAVAAFIACSTDICHQEFNLVQDEINKEDACFTANTGVSITYTPTNCQVNACENGISSCSAQDQQLLQDEINCEQSAFNTWGGNCTDGGLQAFALAAEKCALDGGAVSSACSTAVSKDEAACDAGAFF